MIFSHVLYQLSYPARRSGSGMILRHQVVAIKREAALCGLGEAIEAEG